MTREELKKFRLAYNLTQTQLADLLQVRLNTISRWELGRCEIRHPYILKLACERLVEMWAEDL